MHVITVLGQGKTGRGRTVSAIETLVDSIPHREGEEPTFIFPVLETISPAQKYVAEWADDMSYPYVFVLNPGADGTISDTLLDGAREIIDLEDGDSFVTEVLREMSDEGRVLIAWDDENEKRYEALIGAAAAQGIKSYDLTANMALLEVDGEDEPYDKSDDSRMEIEEDEDFLAGAESDAEEHITYGTQRVMKGITKILDEAQAQIHHLLREYAQEQMADLAKAEAKRARKAVAKERVNA